MHCPPFLVELTGPTADGKCVLDIEASPGSTGDKASMAQISAAALHLLNICVLPEHAGGQSTGYGMSVMENGMMRYSLPHRH